MVQLIYIVAVEHAPPGIGMCKHNTIVKFLYYETGRHLFESFRSSIVRLLVFFTKWLDLCDLADILLDIVEGANHMSLSRPLSTWLQNLFWNMPWPKS